MRAHRWIGFTGLVFLASACAQEPATAPDQAAVAAPETSIFRTARGLKVLSQNIYVGADVDAIIEALGTPDPLDDIAVLQQQIGILQETSFPTRANALADLLARERPEIVGLSEVSVINIDLTGLGLPVVYQVDFQAEIERAIAEHHLPYRVAARVRNFEASPVPGISLVDYTLTLVDRHRVKVGHDVMARLFSNNLGPVAPGVSLAYGFVTLPVTVAGERYVVATTHLQADIGGVNLSLLRAAQMQELLAVIGDAHRAVILGDLNDFAGTPMYQLAMGAGFADVWATLWPGTDGFTCCHGDNLTDSRVLNQRIDFVFARGFDRHDDPVTGFIRRLGVLPSEQFPGPVHPLYLSDHAGLVATLVTPCGKGH